MEQSPTNPTVNDAVRSVQSLKIDGYCATAAMDCSQYIKSRWNIDGHDWEVHFYPKYSRFNEEYDEEEEEYTEWVALKLILLSEPQRTQLSLHLSCRLVCPFRAAFAQKCVSHMFDGRSKCSPEVFLMRTHELSSSGYLMNDSLTVECTLTMFHLDNLDITDTDTEQPLTMPSSDLHQHLGELLQSQDGADVTFYVSGESFAAHKAILAARSPVFKAEFFGGMEESSSKSVEIEGMEAAVFKSMLHFIYTDMAPEFDEEPEVAVTMAQNLLAAADRYGVNRLKLICEGKLCSGIGIDTAATTLALAEQHYCSVLKAKCLEFITKSPETLEAVLATDGYKHLVASCPSVLTELLLRTARGKKI